MIDFEAVNEWVAWEDLDDLNEDLMPQISVIFFHSFLVVDFQELGENTQISVKISRSV